MAKKYLVKFDCTIGDYEHSEIFIFDIFSNKLFFLEPLEATAIGSYIIVCRYLFDWLFLNNINDEIIIDILKEEFKWNIVNYFSFCE